MINNENNPVEWSTLYFNLQDASEHINELINEMSEPEFSEIEFSIQLGHIYAHLNRAWNGRNLREDQHSSQLNDLSGFPKDIEPNP